MATTKHEVYELLRREAKAELESEDFLARVAPVIEEARAMLRTAVVKSSGPAPGGQTVQARLLIGGKRRTVSIDRSVKDTDYWVKQGIFDIVTSLTEHHVDPVTSWATDRVLARVDAEGLNYVLVKDAYVHPSAGPNQAVRDFVDNDIRYMYFQEEFFKEVLKGVEKEYQALFSAVGSALKGVPAEKMESAAAKMRLSKARRDFVSAAREVIEAGMTDAELDEIIGEAKVRHVMSA